MKHRTWITEALRLHFEEHLSRVEADRHLGVPKTTVCSLFVRFRKAGLSWPLKELLYTRYWYTQHHADFHINRLHTFMHIISLQKAGVL